MDNFNSKYLKYKFKYLELKKKLTINKNGIFSSISSKKIMYGNGYNEQINKLKILPSSIHG